MRTAIFLTMHRHPNPRKPLLLLITALTLTMGISIGRIKNSVPAQNALRPVETAVGLAISHLPAYDFGQDVAGDCPLTDSSRDDACATIASLSSYHGAIADLVIRSSERSAIPRLHARVMRSCLRRAIDEPLVA